MIIKNYLAAHPKLAELFIEIPTEELDCIDIQQYAPNETLIQKGSTDTNLFIILHGICDVMNELETGLSICNYKLSSMDIVGFTEIISEVPQRIATISARTSVTTAIIPKDSVLKWFGLYPQFTKQLTCSIINRLHHSLIVVAECNSYSLRANLLSYLIHGYEVYQKIYPSHYTGPVKINESRQMISEFLSVDVRSVNRAVENLKIEDLISIIRGKIHISPVQYEALVKAKFMATQS